MKPSWDLPHEQRVECAAIVATTTEARAAVRESGLDGEDAWYLWIAFVEDELPLYIDAFDRTM